jgi:hypothetical protein
MSDFIRMPELSDACQASLRDAFRGGEFSASLTATDTSALNDHGLVPLLYAQARVAALRDAAIEAAAIETLRLDDLRDVLEALDAGGVVPLILKGTALAYELYSAPELRPRTDVDLLIDRRDLENVRQALQAIGFDERMTSGDELGVRQHGFARRDRFGVMHAYDVHLDITNTAVFAGVLRYDELLARAITNEALGNNARGLSRIDALLLACVHRVAHHYDSDRLIWLYDIHLLRESMTGDEHRAFWQLAAERRVIAVCARSIERAGEWFAGAAHHRAEEFLDSATIARDEPSRHFLDRNRSRGSLLAGDLAALPGWRARATRLWHLAFPPRSFMRETFGSANPLTYTWRAVRGVTRLFRRVVPE